MVRSIVAISAAFVGVLLAFPALALAQPDTPIPVPATDWYASATGIIAASVFGVALLKRVLGNVRGFNAVPTFVYVIVLSEILTLICVQVFRTMPGPLPQALYQALILAASASGAYEWFFNSNKSLAASALSAGIKVPVRARPDSMKD